MSDRYPGGLIRKTPPTITPPVDGEGGSAPGIWTLEQVAYYIKEGTWPQKVIPRELYSWGDGGAGQLGLNAAVNVSSPVQVGALTTWSKIGAGNSSSVAIKTDGTMWSWGSGNSGRTGQNSIVDTSSPVQIGALTTWSQVGVGNSHNLALKTDATMWSWGNSANGRLGVGTSGINASSPVQIGLLTTWAQVAVGNGHSLALKTDGTVWSWGSNSAGQLGLNDAVDCSSPVQIGALTTWSQVAAGNSHTVALKTDGTMWSWGYGVNGQLGVGTAINVSSPVQIGALTTWLLLPKMPGAQHVLALSTL